MKLTSGLYHNIIAVMLESCYSSDESGVLQMDDIKPDYISEWTPSISEEDKKTVIDAFEDCSEYFIPADDLKSLEFRQAYYPVDENYFSIPLNFEKPVFLGHRSFKVPVFNYEGNALEDFEFQPDFDLFYKVGTEFVKIEFKYE